MTQTFELTNRHGLKMYAYYDPAEAPKRGVAIVQHGYAGHALEGHIKGFSEVFRAHGFDTLRLDCTCSFNPSDGELEDNTIYSHAEDLQDAVVWAKGQDWLTVPFALIGHSLGAFSVADYAEDHPREVSLLCPLAAVISGPMLYEAFEKNLPAGEFEDWKEKGHMTIISDDGQSSGTRPFSWLTGAKEATLLDRADNLTMPVLQIVGEKDIPTPPEHQKILHDRLPGDKELHVIPDSDHCYGKGGPFLDVACAVLDEWLARH